MWAEWADGRPAEKVLVLPDCNTDNADEVCVSFAGHPGCHTFEYTDPEDPAHLYPSVGMSAEREAGGRPR
ncbi:hypothetical protein ACFRI7_10065 [Streptomyces sp. NPDC056716]|uniref:hypothetical protein n=1 Tax=unclassified Streptomyces TaxID=2593676 RepID=UPI00367E86B1